MAQEARGRLVTQAVAAELRSIMGRRGINRTQLVESSGVPKSTLSSLLAGATAMDLDQLKSICDALGVQSGDVLNAAVTAIDSEANDPSPIRGDVSPLATEIAYRLVNEDTDEELLHRLAGVRAVTGRSQAAMIALETSIRDHWRTELLEQMRTLPKGSTNSPGANETA